MDARLDRHVLDTGLVPPPDRFGMWLDMLADSPAPLRVHTEHADDFLARAEFIELGRLRLIRYHYPSLDGVRTRKLIQRSDPDYYALALTLTGTGIAGQAGRQSECRPGDFTFYDCSRPHEVSHHGLDRGLEAASSVVALIPYDALPLPHRRLSALFAGRMSGTEGVGGLLADYLLQLTGHPEQYHAADAERLAGIGLDLIATMLGRHLVSEDEVPTEVRRRALLAQVRSHIRQHLGDPAMSPQQIADAHHISVRSLHRLFEAEETTVAACIRDQRLQRCRLDLADPALRDQPVQHIAARWGFRDKAHFSRAFRAAYGETPQAYRARRLERARIVNTAAFPVNS
ncbi:MULTISPECIES: helix-turn-helix domain-containing protein [Micromonospora]|uniref:Helix-turn-helix domain-containing protein n=1 Tax=Micromonospora solifontis TaxID=2487138 RepID=A0ABX9W8I7_9ACTN|nr:MULTISPECIES: helix-turn-helix domain-containing protein [Micromonospora]NES13379.1 helix-turn-helix domain-containing protein [Micromonospora sp. PPF5-17B]NES39650.1 helix-turn-helix domain-containing protein [Micromonospora solifontis]NES55605.1 helix-turn-helix domain-containing protein [Micromonospora sp. PPF5-6]RNL87783.1 helix-turn-helix domain-containing protein [Micromonospora solifontis]